MAPGVTTRKGNNAKREHSLEDKNVKSKKSKSSESLNRTVPISSNDKDLQIPHLLPEIPQKEILCTSSYEDIMKLFDQQYKNKPKLKREEFLQYLLPKEPSVFSADVPMIPQVQREIQRLKRFLNETKKFYILEVDMEDRETWEDYFQIVVNEIETDVTMKYTWDFFKKENEVTQETYIKFFTNHYIERNVVPVILFLNIEKVRDIKKFKQHITSLRRHIKIFSTLNIISNEEDSMKFLYYLKGTSSEENNVQNYEEYLDLRISPGSLKNFLIKFMKFSDKVKYWLVEVLHSKFYHCNYDFIAKPIFENVDKKCQNIVTKKDMCRILIQLHILQFVKLGEDCYINFPESLKVEIKLWLSDCGVNKSYFEYSQNLFSTRETFFNLLKSPGMNEFKNCLPKMENFFKTILFQISPYDSGSATNEATIVSNFCQIFFPLIYYGVGVKVGSDKETSPDVQITYSDTCGMSWIIKVIEDEKNMMQKIREAADQQRNNKYAESIIQYNNILLIYCLANPKNCTLNFWIDNFYFKDKKVKSKPNLVRDIFYYGLFNGGFSFQENALITEKHYDMFSVFWEDKKPDVSTIRIS